MALKHFPILGLGAVLLLLLNYLVAPAASFNFLQSLEGSQKDKTVKGVYKLKQYLKQFGYLHYNKTHATHANDDEFDELLESAVKTYQLNYHLNVTGTLDSETVKNMMKPRCGVPDIINGQTRMRSGKNNKHQGRGLHSLHTVSHYSFFNGNPPPRWPESKFHLTYTFTSDYPVDVQTLRSFIPRAFQRWADVSHFTFAEAEDGSSADLQIEFRSLDGPGNTLGLSYQPTIGLFRYDADEHWSTNPTSDEFDLESVAVHEIGHLLGLGHSEFPDAIMYPTIGPGIKKLDLENDDIQGISALYGG